MTTRNRGNFSRCNEERLAASRRDSGLDGVKQTARRGQPLRPLSTRCIKELTISDFLTDDEDTSDSEASLYIDSPKLESIDSCSPIVSEWESDSEDDLEICNANQEVQAEVKIENIKQELKVTDDSDATEEFSPDSSGFENQSVTPEPVFSSFSRDDPEPVQSNSTEDNDDWDSLTINQKMQTRVGLCHLPGWKESNLVRIGEIIERAKIYMRRLKMGNILNVVLFEKTMDYSRDNLYLFVRKRQCFVVLYRSNQMECYVSDGANSFLLDPKNLETLIPQSAWRQKIRVKVIEYCLQEYVDEGAVSAVMIMMEFQRYYSGRKQYDLIGWPECFTNHPQWYLEERRVRWHKDKKAARLDRKSVALNHKRVTHCLCGVEIDSWSWTFITTHRRLCKDFQNELRRLGELERVKRVRFE